MYSELKLIPLNDDCEKIEILFNNIIYYQAFKSASESLIKIWPSINEFKFNELNLMVVIIIRKGVFKGIYDLLEDFNKKIKEFETLNNEEIILATKLGITDRNILQKVKSLL